MFTPQSTTGTDRHSDLAGVLDQLEIYAALCVECLLTTWDNAAVGLGNVLNQVRNLYNDFGQQTYSIQDHSGAVTGASPRVIYSYADDFWCHPPLLKAFVQSSG